MTVSRKANWRFVKSPRIDHRAVTTATAIAQNILGIRKPIWVCRYKNGMWKLETAHNHNYK